MDRNTSQTDERKVGSSGRSTIREHAERAAPEKRNEVLAAGMVAHVAFTDQGEPYVVPFTYHFDASKPDKLYLHGGQNGRALAILKSGAPVCIEVTLLDGLVYSRDAMFHSMNYRSCICFGTAHEITDPVEKRTVFTEMIRRYFPGREPGRDYNEATDAQTENTAVFEVEIQESSAKTRTGGPRGPRDLQSGSSGSGGVIELETVRHDLPQE